MKALVTGATGFIGSHLVESLLGRGYSVRCLVRLSSSLKWIEPLISSTPASELTDVPSVELVYGDCLKKDSLDNAVRGVDYIFHLAGLTKACRKEDFFSVNVGATENLINAALSLSNGRLRRFLYLSSQAAAGPSMDGKPVSEETEPSPVSFYGQSKLEAERAVLAAGGDIPVTILRPAGVYGPRDRDFYVLFKMIKMGIFPYWGNMLYSIVYIDDLINGIILSAERDASEGRTYFISDMEVHSNDEIALEIARIFNRQPVRLRLPRVAMPLLAGIGEKIYKGGIINRDKVQELGHACWLCDSALATRELGYKPKVSLREGLRWTADWYRINRWL